MLLLQPQILFAAELKLSPDLFLSLSYTDNVNIFSTAQNNDGWIAQINPSLSLEVDGNRSSGEMKYRMQNIRYARDFFSSNQGLSRTHHQLNASGNVEIMDDILGVDAAVDYLQHNRPGQQFVSFDNIGSSDNIINVTYATVSPYADYQLGDYADINLRYSYSQVDYPGKSLYDKAINDINMSLQSGRQFKRFLWRMNRRREKVSYFSQPDIVLNRIDVNTQSTLWPRVSLLLNAGYERNHYPHLVGQPLPRGRYWSSGLGWKFSDRTSANILTGKRYYGDTVSFRFQHRTLSGQWYLEYQETLSTGVELQSSRYDNNDSYQQETTLSDLDGVDKYYDRLNTLSTTEAFIRKRFTLDHVMNIRKMSFRINVVYDNNRYQLSDESEHILTGNASWSLRLSPRSSLIISEYDQHIEYRDQLTKAGLQRFSVTLERRVNQKMSSSYSYRHSSRHTSNSLGEYQQNFIEVGLRLEY